MTVRSLPRTPVRELAPDVVVNACVVIVDDHPANAVLLERMLRSVGIADVHTVTDARTAPARCLEVGADLVLLDLLMPGMDGHEVLRRLRETTPEGVFLPVLVLTADTTVEARDRALQAGANDFLTKPFDHTEVILRVRNLLETRALHAGLRQRNASLRADLDARAAIERRAARDQQARAERLDAALAPGAFEMVFQPVADLRTGGTVGVEALARFTCEPRRPPNVWFDEAASAGRGAELELAAARAALGSLDRLPPEVFLSVNVSPSTAMLGGLADLVASVDARRLVLELTEHVRVDDYGPLIDALDELRSRGVRIAVDDTGSGYAGLEHILTLRPDILKLDIALTRGIASDPARRALATALVCFAHEIGATIIAEGIETEDEFDTLRELGIGWGQGYHIARPGPLLFPSHHVDRGPLPG